MVYFAALRCVISNFCIDCLWLGFHIDAQYSRFGRTILKYAADFVSWLVILRFYFRNPSMLLADLFLHSYESAFLQKLVKDKKIHEARAFNFSYRYIDDVLSINNSRFAEFLR